MKSVRLFFSSGIADIKTKFQNIWKMLAGMCKCLIHWLHPKSAREDEKKACLLLLHAQPFKDRQNFESVLSHLWWWKTTFLVPIEGKLMFWHCVQCIHIVRAALNKWYEHLGFWHCSWYLHSFEHSRKSEPKYQRMKYALSENPPGK